MPQHVHGDGLLAQRWTGASGNLDVLGKTVLERVTAERSAAAGGEQRLSWLTRAFSEPAAEDRARARDQRRDPLLASLSQTTDMGASTKMDIGAVQADQLGHAQTCLRGQRQQGAIAPPGRV